MFASIDKVLASRAVRLLGGAIALLGIGFLVWGLVAARQMLGEALAGLGGSTLAATVLTLVAASWMSAAAIRGMLYEIGYRKSLRSVYGAVFVANLAKYVPGGVWQVGSHIQWFQRLAVPARPALAIWMLNAIASVGAAALVGGGGWLIYRGGSGWLWTATAAGAVVGAGLLVPQLRWAIAGRLMATARPRSVARAWTTSLLALLGAVLVLVHGYLLSTGLGLSADVPPVAAGGALLLAWVVGFLFIPSPNGLGAREGALLLFLAPWLQASEIALLAATSRVAYLLADLLAAGMAGFLLRRPSTVAQPPTGKEESE